MEKINAKKVANAILEAQGNLAEAAQALGVSRATVSHLVEADEACKAAVEEASETLLDVAEEALVRLALDGQDGPDLRALQCLLNAKGAKRGYGKSTIEESGALLEQWMAATRASQAALAKGTVEREHGDD